MLDASSVEASTEEYHREWPIREWTALGEANIARCATEIGLLSINRSTGQSLTVPGTPRETQRSTF